MKKKQIKTLILNKLKISKIDFSEKIKGGSLKVCSHTMKISCTFGGTCDSGNMGG
jgi:hypothetical protein